MRPVLITLIVITAVYWTSASFFPARYVIEFIDGFAISCSLAVMIVYGRQFLKGLSDPKPDVLSLVIVGIAGGWLINGIDRTWRLIGRVTSNPAMVEHHVIGYLLILLATFACLHLIVRRAVMNGMSGALGAFAVWLDIAVW